MPLRVKPVVKLEAVHHDPRARWSQEDDYLLGRPGDVREDHPSPRCQERGHHRWGRMWTTHWWTIRLGSCFRGFTRCVDCDAERIRTPWLPQVEEGP